MFLSKNSLESSNIWESFTAGKVSELDAQANSVIKSGRPFQKETPLYPTPNQRPYHSPLNLRGAQPASPDQIPNF